MRTWCFRTALGIGLAAGLAVLATPRSADAFIHENHRRSMQGRR